MNFEISPFGVPHSFDRAKDIKTVVSKSFSFQKQFRVSNACLVVNLVLKRCFDALEIPNRIVYGILDFPDFLTSSMKIPHVWLEIRGNIIDNTFNEDITEDLLMDIKVKGVYKEEDPNDVTFFKGDKDTAAVNIPDHNVTQFKHGLLYPDKFLILLKKIEPCWNYYVSMKQFVENNFGVKIKEIDSNLENNCWVCNQNVENVEKTKCTKCCVARYCGK